MSSAELIVVGDCNPDLIMSGDDLVPEFGQAEKIVQSAELTLGGSGAITAVQASKLDVVTSFAGVVGADHLGNWCLERLSESGVNADLVLVDQEVATAITVVLSRAMGGAGEGDRAMLTYPGSIERMDGSMIDDQALDSCRHVHFSSYFLQPLLQLEIPRLARKAKRIGATVSLDTNWDPHLNWDCGIELALREIDILFVNQEELGAIARALHQGSVPKSRTPVDIVRLAHILREYGPTVVVKQGAKGAFVVGEEDVDLTLGELDMRYAANDTTGCGDSFDAGFIAAHMSGFTPHEALKIACFCGTSVAGQFGGTPGQPSREMVRAKLSLDLRNRASLN